MQVTVSMSQPSTPSQVSTIVPLQVWTEWRSGVHWKQVPFVVSSVSLVSLVSVGGLVGPSVVAVADEVVVGCPVVEVTSGPPVVGSGVVVVVPGSASLAGVLGMLAVVMLVLPVALSVSEPLSAQAAAANRTT